MVWAKEKFKREEGEIIYIERDILVVFDSREGCFLNAKSRDILVRPESRGKAILEAQEATSRLKSRAIWLEGGNENIKLFQACAK